MVLGGLVPCLGGGGPGKGGLRTGKHWVFRDMGKCQDWAEATRQLWGHLGSFSIRLPGVTRSPSRKRPKIFKLHNLE